MGRLAVKGVTPIRPIWPAAVTARDESVESSTIGVRQALKANSLGRQAQGVVAQEGQLRLRRYLKNRFFLRPVLME